MQNTVPYVETDSYCIISFAMSTYGSYCAISRPITIGIWLMQANIISYVDVEFTVHNMALYIKM